MTGTGHVNDCPGNVGSRSGVSALLHPDKFPGQPRFACRPVVPCHGGTVQQGASARYTAGMKTDALISLCGRLLLALMLAAPAGVALSPSPAMAQAAPAAASDKDKAAQGGNANAAAANPAPAPASPIPPANVVSRAESEENALNIIRNRLQASPQRDGIKQRLARLARDTAEARTLSHLAMDSDSQRRMRDIEPTWAQLQAEVTAVDKQLTQVAEALQEDFNRLNTMQKAWEGAQAAEEIKASPQVIRTRVQEVLNQIQDTRKAASKIRSGIFSTLR